MEIPREIKFNSLLLALGVGLLLLPSHLPSKETAAITLIYGCGLMLILAGTVYTKNEYDMELELLELEYAKRKQECLTYFKEKKLLPLNIARRNLEDIKEILKDMLD